MTPHAVTPLSSVRVIDLTHVLAGPYCTQVLGDLGADVIKVEQPGKGDQTRTIPPFVNGVSHYFLAVNRNKQGVAVNLKNRDGHSVLWRLLETADILVENYRPGVLSSLGFDPDSLLRANPRLIICSISGYGRSGPLAGSPSFDLVTQAMSGVMSINGEPDGPPTKIGLPIGDLAGGMWAVIAILAALQFRQATGHGVHVDVSLLDGLLALLGYLGQIYFVTGESPGRVGSSHHSITPYGRFPVKDGHIVIALHVGSFWRKFCAAIGRSDLADDKRFATTDDRKVNREILEQTVSTVLLTKTTEEWLNVLRRFDVPCAPILTVGEALEQEQQRGRQLIQAMHHSVAGDLAVVGSPLLFDGKPALLTPGPAPGLGEHTRHVLDRVLGLSHPDVDRLIANGAIAELDTRAPTPAAATD